MKQLNLLEKNNYRLYKNIVSNVLYFNQKNYKNYTFNWCINDYNRLELNLINNNDKVIETRLFDNLLSLHKYINTYI